MTFFRFITIIFILATFFLHNSEAAPRKSQKEITGQVHHYGERYIIKVDKEEQCYILLENDVFCNILSNIGYTDECRIKGFVYRVHEKNYLLAKTFKKINSKTNSQKTTKKTGRKSTRKTKNKKSPTRKKPARKSSRKKKNSGKKRGRTRKSGSKRKNSRKINNK